MKVFPIALIILTAACALSAQTARERSVWENGVGKRWLIYHLEADDALLMQKKWNEIDRSLAAESNEFAGKYFQYGHMSGYFLIWSEKEGFVYVDYFDVEHPCYFSYGKVSVKDYELTFTTEYESVSSCGGEKSTTPIAWIPADGGKFLIPKTEAHRFGNFYGGFGEFNGFFRKWTTDFPFALKWKKDFKPERNFVLPENFEKDVKTPIDAEITSVGRSKIGKDEPFNVFYDKSSVTPVVIDAGKTRGVTKNLEFVLLDMNGEKAQTLKITSVGRKTSRAIVIRRIDDKGFEGYISFDELSKEFIGKPFPPIRAGQRISTSPFRALNF